MLHFSQLDLILYPVHKCVKSSRGADVVEPPMHSPTAALLGATGLDGSLRAMHLRLNIDPSLLNLFTTSEGSRDTHPLAEPEVLPALEGRDSGIELEALGRPLSRDPAPSFPDP